jgi:hypothetical protein
MTNQNHREITSFFPFAKKAGDWYGYKKHTNLSGSEMIVKIIENKFLELSFSTSSLSASCKIFA